MFLPIRTLKENTVADSGFFCSLITRFLLSTRLRSAFQQSPARNPVESVAIFLIDSNTPTFSIEAS